VNLSYLAVLEKEGRRPDISAGHSLGEFSALCAAGVISKEDAMRLVYKRGELMHRESIKHEGAMTALVGLSIADVSSCVAAAGSVGVVSVANHNTLQQIVISGSPEPVDRAAALAAEKGARAIRLKVSGAWHSELIQGAEEEFKAFLDTAAFHQPVTPVIHNVTAETCDDPREIKTLLAHQLCSPVRWYESVENLMRQQVTDFVEIGPGKVLSGLIKKSLPADYPANIYNVNSLKAISEYLEDAVRQAS
jgi:[acyl-carrier-protein] S-malonyltransferase